MHSFLSLSDADLQTAQKANKISFPHRFGADLRTAKKANKISFPDLSSTDLRTPRKANKIKEEATLVLVLSKRQNCLECPIWGCDVQCGASFLSDASGFWGLALWCAVYMRRCLHMPCWVILILRRACVAPKAALYLSLL